MRSAAAGWARLLAQDNAIKARSVVILFTDSTGRFSKLSLDAAALERLLHKQTTEKVEEIQISRGQTIAAAPLLTGRAERQVILDDSQQHGGDGGQPNTSGSTNQAAATSPGSTSQAAATSPGSTSQAAATSPGSTSQAAATSSGSTSQAAATSSGSTSQAAATSSGSTSQAAATSPGSTSQAAATSPASTTAGSTRKAAETAPAVTSASKKYLSDRELIAKRITHLQSKGASTQQYIDRLTECDNFYRTNSYSQLDLAMHHLNTLLTNHEETIKQLERRKTQQATAFAGAGSRSRSISEFEGSSQDVIRQLIASHVQAELGADTPHIGPFALERFRAAVRIKELEQQGYDVSGYRMLYRKIENLVRQNNDSSLPQIVSDLKYLQRQMGLPELRSGR